MASWNVPHYCLMEEEEVNAWITDGSIHYAGIIQKRRAL
jgi:hypothetical protein